MFEFELIFNKFRNNKMVFNKIKEGTKYYNYYVLSKEKLEKENRAKANEIKKKLSEITLTIKAKAGEGGRLFGAITSADIAKKLKQDHKIDVDKKKIELDENIKEAGMKNIDIKLYPDVVASLKVNVRPESWLIWMLMEN